MEYILNSQGLNTPSTYLYRYTTPVEIVLESGKQVLLLLYCYMIVNVDRHLLIRCQTSCQNSHYEEITTVSL